MASLTVQINKVYYLVFWVLEVVRIILGLNLMSRLRDQVQVGMMGRCVPCNLYGEQVAEITGGENRMHFYTVMCLIP